MILGETIRLWSMEKWATIGLPVEDTIEVASFALTRDGQQLISGGGEGTVQFWDAVELLVIWCFLLIR